MYFPWCFPKDIYLPKYFPICSKNSRECNAGTCIFVWRAGLQITLSMWMYFLAACQLCLDSRSFNGFQCHNYKLNPSAGRLWKAICIKLHHTDIYCLSSLHALITIKIYKAVQSIVEDCSTHGRESVLRAFQCPLQPFNDNSKAVQVMTIAFKHKNHMYVPQSTGTWPHRITSCTLWPDATVYASV